MIDHLADPWVRRSSFDCFCRDMFFYCRKWNILEASPKFFYCDVRTERFIRAGPVSSLFFCHLARLYIVKTVLGEIWRRLAFNANLA